MNTFVCFVLTEEEVPQRMNSDQRTREKNQKGEEEVKEQEGVELSLRAS